MKKIIKIGIIGLGVGLKHWETYEKNPLCEVVAIADLDEKKLEKYISNCGGGIAIRNVTDGLRLSNHSWGLAIDMNTVIYPIGTKFATDGIYEGKTKIRDYNDFDLGFIKVTKLFTDEGMTWLKSFDPMHVSIYE